MKAISTSIRARCDRISAELDRLIAEAETDTGLEVETASAKEPDPRAGRARRTRPFTWDERARSYGTRET